MDNFANLFFKKEAKQLMGGVAANLLGATAAYLVTMIIGLSSPPIIQQRSNFTSFNQTLNDAVTSFEVAASNGNVDSNIIPAVQVINSEIELEYPKLFEIVNNRVTQNVDNAYALSLSGFDSSLLVQDYTPLLIDSNKASDQIIVQNNPLENNAYYNLIRNINISSPVFIRMYESALNSLKNGETLLQTAASIIKSKTIEEVKFLELSNNVDKLNISTLKDSETSSSSFENKQQDFADLNNKSILQLENQLESELEEEESSKTKVQKEELQKKSLETKDIDTNQLEEIIKLLVPEKSRSNTKKRVNPLINKSKLVLKKAKASLKLVANKSPAKLNKNQKDIIALQGEIKKLTRSPKTIQSADQVIRIARETMRTPTRKNVEKVINSAKVVLQNSRFDKK